MHPRKLNARIECTTMSLGLQETGGFNTEWQGFKPKNAGRQAVWGPALHSRQHNHPPEGHKVPPRSKCGTGQGSYHICHHGWKGQISLPQVDKATNCWRGAMRRAKRYVNECGWPRSLRYISRDLTFHLSNARLAALPWPQP